MSVLILSLYYISGNEMVISVVDGLWPNLQVGSFLREVFSVVPHYESFTRGIMNLHSIIYFVILIIFTLWMNSLVLERDRH